jgi:phosphoglycerate dehydrogenase-like enzyme
VKLLIKKIDNDGRLKLIADFVTTKWDFEVVDSDNRPALAAALQAADAMISMDWPADMPAAPSLKLLQLPGAGIDDIEFAAVPIKAAVCNVYEHEVGIAEYVMASMLQWVVGIPSMDAALRRGDWTGSHISGPRHRELLGQTLGIVGYGRIGRETAKRAKAFGMHVIACSRTAREEDEVVGRVMPLSELESVLTQADFILLALPLDQGTKSIIGARQLACMKPDGVIINVARGALIDEEALYLACRERRIGGAIIDTWYRYPKPGDPRGDPSAFPFRDLDNVIMTPHASAWSEGLLPRRNRIIAENLDRLASGKPLLNVVQPPSH